MEKQNQTPEKSVGKTTFPGNDDWVGTWKFDSHVGIDGYA